MSMAFSTEKRLLPGAITHPQSPLNLILSNIYL